MPGRILKEIRDFQSPSRHFSCSVNEQAGTRRPPYRKTRTRLTEGNERQDTMSPREVTAAINRVRAEFVEMPGLRLTIRQASRLCGLDQAVCDRAVETLVHRDFLRWIASGLVARAEDAR